MEIKKVFIPAFGAFLNIISLLFMNFAVLRPNRIMSGTYVFAKDYFSSYFYILLAISILLLVFVFLKGKSNKVEYLTSILSGAYLCLLILLFGAMAKGAVSQLGEFARVSIGIGFWVSMAGIYILITSLLGSSEKQKTFKRILLLAILVFISALLILGIMNDVSIIKEFNNRRDTFFEQVVRHLLLSVISVVFGILCGIPIAFYIFKKNPKNSILLFLINIGQTVPTLSLLGLIMVPLAFLGDSSEFLRNLGINGFGVAPSFIILVIYALLPIVYNTVAGLKLVDKNMLEAAAGMGMKKGQIFWKIHVPLSFPVILGGIRTAFTQSVGNTILAGLIGGGGLGSLIFLGLSQAAPDLIMLGIIPLIMMALVIDLILILIIEMSRKRRRMQYLNYQGSLSEPIAE